MFCFVLILAAFLATQSALFIVLLGITLNYLLDPVKRGHQEG